MNKKIKVIELLNKIANGEEPPKKIKKEELEGNSFEDLIDNLKYFDKDFSKTLNDEVEILEDNTEEIEEIEEIKGWGLATDYKDFETINHTLDRFGNKINE